ncbi:MAG: MFS transporter [Spirochaetia bacterium]
MSSIDKKGWILLSVLLAAVLIGYIGRMSISVALPSVTEDFGWSSREQGRLGGLLLGIFLISYGFSNFFLSPFIDRIGPKVTLSVSSLITAVSLFFAGLFGHMYFLFLFSRLLLGLAQGVVFPSASKIITTNFSLKARSRANSIFISGAPLGSLITPLVVTPIIIVSSWELALYAVGLFNILCIIPVLLVIPRGNENAEKADRETRSSTRGVIKSLFGDVRFRLLLLSFTAMMSVWWGLVLWLPTYLIEEKGFLLSEMQYGASIIYLGAACGLFLGSWLSDITGERRRIISSGLFIAALFLVVITVVSFESKLLGVVLIFSVLIFLEMAPPVFFTLMQKMVPNSQVGTASGIMNGLGNVGGIIGPIAIGLIVSSTGSYALGLLFLGGCAFLGGSIVHFFYREA